MKCVNLCIFSNLLGRIPILLFKQLPAHAGRAAKYMIVKQYLRDVPILKFFFLVPILCQSKGETEFQQVHFHQKKKSNLHYIRGMTPQRVTTGVAHLHHSSEETSQRWRACTSD